MEDIGPMMPSQAKKYIRATLALAVAAILGTLPARSPAEETTAAASRHTWGSKRIDATIWGIARGDMDGSGRRAIIVMERRSLWIARIDGHELLRGASFEFPAGTEGVRLFTMDVDGDGRDEAVVSALAYGTIPSSLIITHRNGTLKPLLTGIPWHLRVIGTGAKASLIGQRASGNDLYSGKMYRLTFVDGKITTTAALDLPRWANIFNNALIPPRVDEHDELVSLNMYAPLKAFERRGKRWKKFWTSGGRFGGTLRFAERTTRPPLDDIPEYSVPIGREPITLNMSGTTLLVAARHDMPLKNIVGRGQLILGGNLVAFARNDALGFTEVFMSERLPGYIADYIVDVEGGVPMLYAAIQTDPEVFNPSPQSSIVAYRLVLGHSPPASAPAASRGDEAPSAAATP